MIIDELITYLHTNTSVPKIYAVVAPDDLDNFPCITYQIASQQNTDKTISSVSSASTIRLVLNVFSQSYKNLIVIENAIETMFNGYYGELSGGTRIQFAELINKVDGNVSGDIILYKSSLHFSITYI
jgi:hypothetical protein